MQSSQNPNARIVALDVGKKRIGVASANVIARLASPLTTLDVSDNIIEDIKQLLARETAQALVIGLPRNLQGEDTDQTRTVRQFAAGLEKQISIPIYWQDEALTSHLSKERLKVSQKTYQKGQVDALAATYILEDYLVSMPDSK
ncbi:MAG: Holliday junction resolvase RuvX [Candidatus Saccharibacteria bacterium]